MKYTGWVKMSTRKIKNDKGSTISRSDIKKFFIAVGASIVAGIIIAMGSMIFQLPINIVITIFISSVTLIIGFCAGNLLKVPRMSRHSRQMEREIDNIMNDINVSRTKQSLTLILYPCIYKDEPAIKVIGKHKYTLKNISDETLEYSINYSAELGIQGEDDTGGLEYAKIGDEEEYDKDQIKNYVNHVNTDPAMVYFNLSEKSLEPNGKLTFEFKTYGIYRVADHLIWTFQEYCEKDSTVEVINKVDDNENEPTELYFRVNHNEYDKLTPQGTSKHTIKFKRSILPFGGFVVSWDFPGDVVSKKYNEKLEQKPVL
jgi:hypothetical protein